MLRCKKQGFLSPKIEKGLALFFLLSGTGNFIFIFSIHYGFVEIALPNYGYLEGVVGMLVSITVFIGLWRQRTWGYYLAISYVFLATIYALVEALMLPIEAWTLAYLASVMLLNAVILFLLDCALASHIKILRVINRYAVNIMLSVAVFFIVSYLFNAIVALFTLISLVYVKQKSKQKPESR